LGLSWKRKKKETVPSPSHSPIFHYKKEREKNKNNYNILFYSYILFNNETPQELLLPVGEKKGD